MKAVHPLIPVSGKNDNEGDVVQFPCLKQLLLPHDLVLPSNKRFDFSPATYVFQDIITDIIADIIADINASAAFSRLNSKKNQEISRWF